MMWVALKSIIRKIEYTKQKGPIVVANNVWKELKKLIQK